MPRPTTKPELIKAANDEFTKMWQIIDSMTDAEQREPLALGDITGKNEAHWARDMHRPAWRIRKGWMMGRVKRCWNKYRRGDRNYCMRSQAAK